MIHEWQKRLFTNRSNATSNNKDKEAVRRSMNQIKKIICQWPQTIITIQKPNQCTTIFKESTGDDSM